MSKTDAHVLNKVEELAMQEKWDEIIDLCSKTILHGCKFSTSINLYWAWIEALRANYHMEGLCWLGSHLTKIESNSWHYKALATMAYIYAGKWVSANKLYEKLDKLNLKNWLFAELKAIKFCESLSKKDQKTGVVLLNRVSNSLTTWKYFAGRNWYSYALECDYYLESSKAVNWLVKFYPKAPEALWTIGLIAANDKKWGHAVDAFENLLKTNPHNAEAILAYTRGLELSGDLITARTVLSENAKYFDKYDYEYNINMGMIAKKLYQRYSSPNYFTEAMAHLKLAATCAPNWNMPEAPIYAAIFELNEVSKPEVTKVKDPNYWLMLVPNKEFVKILSQGKMLVRNKAQIKYGDVVFLTRQDKSKKDVKRKVEGIINAISEPLPDSRLGSMISLGNIKIFTEPVNLDNEAETQGKLYGRYLDLFDNTFVKIEPKHAELIIQETEHHEDMRIQAKASYG